MFRVPGDMFYATNPIGHGENEPTISMKSYNKSLLN
jgi:hypothetical protein